MLMHKPGHMRMLRPGPRPGLKLTLRLHPEPKPRRVIYHTFLIPDMFLLYFKWKQTRQKKIEDPIGLASARSNLLTSAERSSVQVSEAELG